MKKISDYLDNKKIIIAILLVASIFTLLICSKNSPLYPYNDWVDGNAFFTMGKGMFNGKVPYKDLFEQKGPLLYFIYGIGYLISHDTFLGVYLLEVISYTIFGYFLPSFQPIQRASPTGELPSAWSSFHIKKPSTSCRGRESFCRPSGR